MKALTLYAWINPSWLLFIFHEISGNEEPSQEKDNDENESQDKDEPIGIDKDKDEDKGIDNAKDEDGDKGMFTRVHVFVFLEFHKLSVTNINTKLKRFRWSSYFLVVISIFSLFAAQYPGTLRQTDMNKSIQCMKLWQLT